MNEMTLQLVGIAKLGLVSIFASLYALGGMKDKWRRRYMAPFLLASGLTGLSFVTHTFSPWLFLWMFLLMGALHLGYGATELPLKLWKRFYVGAAVAVSALPLAIVYGSWTMFTIHTVMCIGFSMTLGVINPTSARNEETLIGLAYSLLPAFMI